ncbi:MAG: hypothetical protein AB1589_22575 [Cyanobacteriota bacterium]
MTITEPMTMLTDYAIAAETSLFAVLLVRVAHFHRHKCHWFWAATFSAVALASIAGGTYHGFTLYLEGTTKGILWQVTVYSISLASFLMLSGTIIASVPSQLQQWFLVGSGLKFLYVVGSLYFIDAAAIDKSFAYVVADYISAMVVVLILQAYAAYRCKSQSAGWIIAGILVSFVATGIQQSGFMLAKNFNHNDIYHIIQMIAFYLFYRGAHLLKDW